MFEKLIVHFYCQRTYVKAVESFWALGKMNKNPEKCRGEFCAWSSAKAFTARGRNIQPVTCRGRHLYAGTLQYRELHGTLLNRSLFGNGARLCVGESESVTKQQRPSKHADKQKRPFIIVLPFVMFKIIVPIKHSTAEKHDSSIREMLSHLRSSSPTSRILKT